jgi:hypothetical protein
MTAGHRGRRQSAVLSTVVGSVVVGLVAVGGLTTPAAAGVSSAPQASSAVRLPAATRVSAQQLGCQPRVAVTTPDTHSMAFLDHDNLTGATVHFDQIAPATGVSALGSTTYDMLASNQRWYVRTFAVRNGSLTHELTSYPNSAPTQVSQASKVLGPGWGNVTKLADATDRDGQSTKAGWLYALNPTAGTLSRYSVSEARIG